MGRSEISGPSLASIARLSVNRARPGVINPGWGLFLIGVLVIVGGSVLWGIRTY